MANLPPEKLAEIRQIIHDQLVHNNIQEHIKESVANVISRNASFNENGSSDLKITEKSVMGDLKRRGIVQGILDKLQLDAISPETKPATNNYDHDRDVKIKAKEMAEIDSTKRYLYFQILGGKAFLDHLNISNPNAANITSHFILNIHFRGQRFRSKPVPVACEPCFNDGFLLELNSKVSGERSGLASVETMLSLNNPIHIVLTRYNSDDTNELVSSHSLEWRNVLQSKCDIMNKTVELMGVGSECKVPVGIIETRFQLFPSHKTIKLSHDVVEAQMCLEKQRVAERDRLFLVFAKQWWKEYLEIRNEHKLRSVKIFAQLGYCCANIVCLNLLINTVLKRSNMLVSYTGEFLTRQNQLEDETGMNRPVFSYVQPFKAGRLLSTPRQAARFVSVLPHDKGFNVGTSNGSNHWQSTFSFLCSKKGDNADHSNLLCSLLLGFGLDAYVCIGTKKSGAAYTWVMTKYCDGYTVYFWDPKTGKRFLHEIVDPDQPPAHQQPIAKHNFKTIGCLYNHLSFYANSQALDHIETICFELENQALWKQMNVDAIRSVNGNAYPNICKPFPPLKTPTLDSTLISSSVEQEIMALVSCYREGLDLSTQWDSNLSYLLSSSLTAYELDRSGGCSKSCNENFQDAIRRAVPEGNTFKGFPIQFLHRNPCKAFSECLKNQICADIIECRGNVVRMAVRVNITIFPDDAVAMWIMFACRYQSVV